MENLWRRVGVTRKARYAAKDCRRSLFIEKIDHKIRRINLILNFNPPQGWLFAATLNIVGINFLLFSLKRSVTPPQGWCLIASAWQKSSKLAFLPSLTRNFEF